MNEGELLIDGTPDELVKNDQARKVYLGKTFSM
jgi:ABC-type lipopolysaccharide export system ATPase subunit